MNVKALLKAICVMAIILSYIAAFALLSWKDCQVGLIIICAPLPITALACVAISLYDIFKEEDEK